MRAFFDLLGREVALGRCLGRGGEGAVYAIPRRPGHVAKVYAQRPDDELVRKLGAMIATFASSPCETLAWPTGLLLDGRGGAAVGFLMPRVDGCRPLHALYGPGTRAENFPEARWDFLVRAARNLASAFESVHGRGLVVGDVNEGNAVVSSKAVVRLIDCDSFQVTHEGRTYRCPVGVPLFTPPELQGHAFDRVVRTRDHDGFGLAVLLFHLLFMGRHPFAGRHPTREIGVETAIREGLFAFGWEAARQGWKPPPFSLRLADVPAGVAALFERAFSREAARGRSRPSAAEWVAALEDVESRLATCRVDPAHRHARPDGACPFCRIENQGGPCFFVSAPGGRDSLAVWRAIEAVHPPGPSEPPLPRDFPGLVGRPLPGNIVRDRRIRYAVALLAVPAVVLSVATGTHFGLVGVLWALVILRESARGGPEFEARRRAVEECQRELSRQEKRYWTEGSDRPFTRRLEELEAARYGLKKAQETETLERQELVKRIRSARLHGHLSRHLVADAPIPRLELFAMLQLQGNGIHSAADVEPSVFDQRPGPYGRSPQVGPALAAELLAWRARLEQEFVFDPAKLRPSEFESLERQQRTRREAWEQALRSGAAGLVQLRRAILARRQEMLPELEAVQRRLVQARADLAAISP